MPRQDTNHEAYVVVLSNSTHIAADTGRLITCPYIPGLVPEEAMAMVVAVRQPDGVVLPELVQWLPSAALDTRSGTSVPRPYTKPSPDDRALLVSSSAAPDSVD